jgi:hypothetical protein
MIRRRPDPDAAARADAAEAARVAADNNGRRYVEAAIAVRQEHPEWTTEEQRAEAYRRVGPVKLRVIPS